MHSSHGLGYIWDIRNILNHRKQLALFIEPLSQAEDGVVFVVDYRDNIVLR